MKNNRKGFTLAELLIVVAIIAVLVAIAIPVFTGQLEKAREATDAANVRSAYATLVADYLENGKGKDIKVDVTQKKADWQTDPAPTLTVMSNGTSEEKPIPAKTTGQYTVAISDDGVVSVN
jgi:type IV pilus assembly protein PilA